MKCPNCHKSCFHKEGYSVYCANCFYHLNKSDRHKWRSQQKNFLPGVSVKELAVIKHAARDTIYHNLHQFNILDGFKSIRINFDEKALGWNQSLNQYQSRNFKFQNLKNDNFKN